MHFSMILQYGCHKEVLHNYIKPLLKILHYISKIYMRMENWRKIQLVSITYKFNKRDIGKFKER